MIVFYFLFIFSVANLFYLSFFKRENKRRRIFILLIIAFVASTLLPISLNINSSKEYFYNMSFFSILSISLILLNFFSHYITTKLKFVKNYLTYIITFSFFSFFLNFFSYILLALIFGFSS